jgi:CBS domain-containing protein
MLIQEIMTIHPVYIREDADMRRAAEIISIADVSDIMVVDDDKNFVGVISSGDLLRTILPNYDEVFDAGGTLADVFSFFVRKGHDLAAYPISPIVIKNPITLRLTDEAAQAATVMLRKQISSLPVVDNGKLVGSVSRSDICRAIIYYA